MLTAPKNGACVDITNPLVKDWWENYEKFSSAEFETVQERAKPSPITLKWQGGKNCNYTLYLSTSPKLKKSRVFKTKQKSIKLYNLLRNQKYYWRVSEKKGKTKTLSKIRSFKTNNIARVIYAKGVANIRDIGGYKTENGSRTKQGLVYRSANLDNITISGKKVLTEELEIKTDLDLRKDEEGTAGTDSPALDDYLHRRGSNYEDIFEYGETKDRFILGVKEFADKSNYPILFHCTYGRDRTGTLAFVLNGLLGVSKKNLFRDYELSFLTRKGSSKAAEYISKFDRLYDRMASYNDKSMPLSYNIECFLMNAGVTEEEIQSIKEILA